MLLRRYYNMLELTVNWNSTEKPQFNQHTLGKGPYGEKGC